METVDKDIVFSLTVVAIFTLLFGGLLYGTYQLGRQMERRALTKALVSAITETYEDGRRDGEKAGYSKGYAKGLKEFDSSSDNDGRY
jgi:hypothetical protein